MSKFKVGDMVVFTKARIAQGFNLEANRRLGKLNKPMKITEVWNNRCIIAESGEDWKQSSFELAVMPIDFTVLEDI
jgi:hypothetical protein